MIYTLTLNPAIDRTILVNKINYEDVTRVTKKVREAAGKGINVSKVLHNLGTFSVALGYTCGENGSFIKKSLDDLSVVHDFIEVSGETRENIKLIEESTTNVLEINENGPTLGKKEINRLLLQLKEKLQDNDILVISGSVPKGVNTSIYQKIIKSFPNVTTLLDASGALFQESIDAKPTIIKPNKYELEQYANRRLETIQDVVAVCESILEKGVTHIFCSLGKQGALYLSKQERYQAYVPALTPKSTVGAGDSFVAGLVKAFSKNIEPKLVLKYACAVGSASVIQEGTAKVNKDDVHNLYQNIIIRPINGVKE